MNKKQKRLAFISSSLVVAAGAAALALTALSSSVAYFYTPSDLAAAAEKPTGNIRLGGLVAAESVRYAEGADARVDFVVEDGAHRTQVTFVGVLPDLFREGQGVVVEGRLAADGSVAASEVLAKHDETYMPREVADALKKQGVWQGEKPGS
ncbi:MAG: cytochrome c maturation protein CcmE [Alphaproteobacteria bacterium]|nr:cytochrome c maturation protein CcmE [Alphaproteobacteria bacterium]